VGVASKKRRDPTPHKLHRKVADPIANFKWAKQQPEKEDV